MLTLWRKKTAPETETEADALDEAASAEIDAPADEARGSKAEPDLAHGWTNGERLKSIASTGVVVGLCLSGPAALGLHFFGSDPAPQTAAVEVQDPAASQRVSEFATTFVTQYLTASRGQEDQVTAMLAQGADRRLSLPEKPAPIGTATPGEAVQTADGNWVVIVAVDQPDESGAAVRRYWQVSVLTDDAGSIAAAGLPSLVTAPTVGDLEVDQGAAINNSAIQDTVTAFMQAYLTGQGEVAPLTAPGSSLSAVQPTPFQELSISSLATTQELPAEPAEGDLLRAQISVTATAADGGSAGLDYTVELRYRDRWEVAAINPTTAGPTTTTGEQS
ncbi:conjugal transfer protein [Brachybacterium alimentarium]|uniref:conjugal transfer protein n=1 Tax=Brachybacterium alimentarium TaxID=47845 RepID=UPI003FD60DFF